MSSRELFSSLSAFSRSARLADPSRGPDDDTANLDTDPRSISTCFELVSTCAGIGAPPG